MSAKYKNDGKIQKATKTVRKGQKWVNKKFCYFNDGFLQIMTEKSNKNDGKIRKKSDSKNRKAGKSLEKFTYTKSYSCIVCTPNITDFLEVKKRGNLSVTFFHEKTAKNSQI